MNILVLATDYPNNNGGVSLAYIHTRNLYYKSMGTQVDVINFSAKENYTIDGINVYPLKWFDNKKAGIYDLLICHAPNLRNHYRFLSRYGGLFLKKVFFFHGHEVLKINSVYPKPYPYVKTNRFKIYLQNRYDDFKLFMWKKYFQKNASSSFTIFVSNWMREEFYKWTKLSHDILKNREFITYNSVGEFFETNSWNPYSHKLYDYITIRAYLDGSKYAVDIVNNLAWKNPTKKFLIIGKGAFFNHYEKAPNITWIDLRLNHKEMGEYLDQSRCALMPTRTDAQGVMMCEMHAYGMPLITSDLPVCHEVFDGLKGVEYINNDNYLSCDIEQLLYRIQGQNPKNTRFSYSIIGAKEYGILKSIVIN